MVALSLCGILVGVATVVFDPRLLVMLFGAFALVIIALVRLHWLIALYLALAPLYFLVKLWLPATLGSIWRDLLLGLIIVGWVFNVLVRQDLRISRKDWKFALVALFALLVLLEIFGSESILTGIFGFRTLFRCLLVYFVGVFLLDSKHRTDHMRLFLNAFLLGAMINAFAAALQFLLISLLKAASPGTWFDPIRLAFQIIPLAPRFGLERALGLFTDPNDIGQILVVALAIMLPRTLSGHSFRSRLAYVLLCGVTFFAIVGTLAIFAILPAALVLLLFFAFGVGGRARNLLIVVSIVGLAAVGAWFLAPRSTVSWEGYTIDQILDSFSYIPRAVVEGNFFGQGYGVYSDLAERFGISMGSTADRSTYWFYLDQIAVQIGLLGILFWLFLWAAFLHAGYRTASRFLKCGDSVQSALSLSSWLALVGLFLSSLHYGPYRVGGIDLLLYLLWAFFGTARPIRGLLFFSRRDRDQALPSDILR